VQTGIFLVVATLALVCTAAVTMSGRAHSPAANTSDVSETALVRSLPGFTNRFATEDHPYLWWFAFNQVKGLPEELLEGRASVVQAWFFRYMLKDEGAIDARDRAVYARAYSSRDAIRAGNAWYQAFSQDIDE